MLKLLVCFLVLHFVFKILAQAPLNSDPVQKAQSAVFQIKTRAGVSGTGFFSVQRDTFFTALHVLHEMMHFMEEGRFEDQIVFLQNGKVFPFRITGVQVVSALYDVVVLKVEGYKGLPLQWESPLSSSSPDEALPFYTLAYLSQGFQVILSRRLYGPASPGDFSTFSISSEYLIDGASGGPVLNSSGKVVGMAKAGISRETKSQTKALSFILEKAQAYKVSLLHFLSRTGSLTIQLQLIKTLYQNLKEKRTHFHNQWLFVTPMESLRELSRLKPSSLSFSHQVRQAFEDLEEQAHANDKFAQFYLSHFLQDQRQKMMSLLQNSSRDKHTQYMKEMEDKRKQGFRWLWQAAEQDLAVAQMSMAHLVEGEYFHWMHRAALQGYLPAQLHLAFYLLSENQSSLQGMKWLYRAARQGHREAQFYLVLYTTKHVPDLSFKSLQWLKRSAAQAYSPAALFLSMLLMVKKPVLTRDVRQEVQALLDRVVQQEYPSLKLFKPGFQGMKKTCQWLFSKR